MIDSSGLPAADPLAALAAAFGVATTYRSAGGTHVAVPATTVRRVLAALGVDASDPAAALADAQSRRWSRLAAPTEVVRSGPGASVLVRAPADVAVHARIAFEEGGQTEVTFTGAPVAEHGTGPGRRRALPLQLPADLPDGYHRMVVSAGAESAEVLLAVTPRRLGPLVGPSRAWGWMAQLYALRSAGSWGMGDYADLATVVADAGSRGAALMLVNPLHACAPTHPVENSPYYPGSRRFSSPLYLRPERLAEYAVADERTRARVDDLRRTVPRAELLDRDGVWAAKRAAFEALFDFRVERAGAEQSAGLRDFATWCALAERHGQDWREWPQPLHDPRGPAVARARAELAGRVAFHEWLQHCCADQLADAQLAAVDAGMEIGIVHDIAVGVDPGGADAWALQDDLATGVSVGRAAGRLQPARAGLAGAAVAARPAAGNRLRAGARHGARRPGPRRRAAPGPRDGAVAAVVGAGRPVAGAGHLRRIRRRRHARDRRFGGRTGRRPARRRGSGHGRTRGAGGPCRARGAGLGRPMVRARRRRRADPGVPSTGSLASGRGRQRHHPRPADARAGTWQASTCGCAASWACSAGRWPRRRPPGGASSTRCVPFSRTRG